MKRGMIKGDYPKPKQAPLFGDQDMVLNTLESERKILLLEIDAIEDQVANRQEKIAALQERIEAIEGSLKALRKATGTEKK